MSHMKRSIVEQLIDNVGETGCLESAFKQNTSDYKNQRKTSFFSLIIKSDHNYCSLHNIKTDLFFKKCITNSLHHIKDF